MQKIVVPVFALIAIILTVQPTHAAELKFDFQWVGWKDKCTPKSPEFKITSAPGGTEKIRFKMVDLNVPSYSHGGGKVKYSGKDIPRGAFKYKGPCPPRGTHKYEWTAIAYDKNGKELGRAKVMKPFPPKK